MTKDFGTLLGISILTIVVGGFITWQYSEPLIKQKRTAVEVVRTPITLADGELEAHSAIIYDPLSGEVLYAKNAEDQVPLASLAKLATALAVLTEGQDRMVTISKDDLNTEGDSGLRVGDIWRLGDLIAFGLSASSNDAMAAAASALSGEGVLQKMNGTASEAGLAQTYFLNPTGLDISSTTAGAYGSARDVAHLTTLILKKYPELFEATTRQPQPAGDSGKGAVSTLRPLWHIPGLIGAKTGFTDLAGGNLTAAVDLGLGEPVIAVVLGSSTAGRFTDMEKLIAAARASRQIQ